jgi:hypothetical protein
MRNYIKNLKNILKHSYNLYLKACLHYRYVSRLYNFLVIQRRGREMSWRSLLRICAEWQIKTSLYTRSVFVMWAYFTKMAHAQNIVSRISLWVTSVGVHVKGAVLTKIAFSIPELFIVVEVIRASFKCATLYWTSAITYEKCLHCLISNYLISC